MAPEFTEDASAAKARMESDLEAAQQWGEERRAGRIRDKGCDSVSRMLADFWRDNPTAAAAVERQREVEKRVQ